MVTLTINLAKVRGAYIAPDANGTPTLCIPSTSLFYPAPTEGRSQGAYLTIDDYQHFPNQWGYTHTLRQRLEQKDYEHMTEAERKELPVIGRGK